ncbi:MAG: phosphotransferase enzyme family protein [Planctomycetaceae bacterium]
MPPTQFMKFHNLNQIVESFCGTKPARIRTIDRDSEGFSGAVVLRVVVPDKLHGSEVEYCLRGWPPESFSRERLTGLHRLLAFVHKSGVKQVPVPLRNKFGTTLYAEASQFWQMEPWMPGRADFSSDPSDARLRNAMSALAQWHEAASRFEPYPAEAGWFQSQLFDKSPTVADRLERIERYYTQDVANLRNLLAQTTTLGDWGQDFLELADLSRRILDAFDRSVESIGSKLQSYCDVKFRLQPCLRDVWHDHVLFDGDQVTGLIDPNAAKTESPATDLARLLGSFLGDDHDRWEFALTAYRQVRPLSDREAKVARVLDQSTVLLSGLTWLERLFVYKEDYANPPRILTRLRQIVARLDRLTNRHQSVIL